MDDIFHTEGEARDESGRRCRFISNGSFSESIHIHEQKTDVVSGLVNEQHPSHRRKLVCARPRNTGMRATQGSEHLESGGLGGGSGIRGGELTGPVSAGRESTGDKFVDVFIGCFEFRNELVRDFDLSIPQGQHCGPQYGW